MRFSTHNPEVVPSSLRCLALGIVEIGRHNHDRVVSQSAVQSCGHKLLNLSDLLLELLDRGVVRGSHVLVDARVGPPQCC